MSSSQIQPRHAFGLKGDVKDNVHYIDESTVIYPAGNNVVVYNTEQKKQKFIPATIDAEGITCLALSPNHKYLAIAEKSEKAIITIFDLLTLKRRKLLVSPECGSREYVSMAFSPDGKTLAAQAGAPEWNLLLWIWEKAKVASMVKSTNQQGMPLYQCAFNPHDGSLLTVCGNQIFKSFRAAESNLKPLAPLLGKREPQNYTTHLWLPDEKERVVVGTDQGELLLVEGGELKGSLVSPGEGIAIEVILPYSKGFIVGGDHGRLSLYEKTEDKDYYKSSKSFAIENNLVKLKSLAIQPGEETLICALENNQMFSLSMANTDIMKADEMNFELFTQSFHSKGITGVDCCVRKPLVATCSTDNSVRIWNYNLKTTELVKFFPEEAFSIAFHPSGLHILVGFADKLRMMNLLMDDIRAFKEFGIKGCKECCFSHGGSYFAAVNNNTIQVYNTYTCDNIGNLRGHNGKVKSVYWSPDDTKLVSAGMDGAVYEWTLKDFKRNKENVIKGCGYNCVLSTPDSHQILAVGSDRKLKEFEESPGAGFQVSKEFDTGGVMTQICLPISGRALFAASETGTIRSYNYPLTGQYTEYQAHAGPITRMRVSFDDTMLFCVSEDGSLFVFDVREKDGRAKAGKEAAVAFAEEVLVTRSDLEEKKARMAELETQVNELTTQNEYKLRLKDLDLNERIKDITEKFTHELEGDKAKFELLLQEKNEQEMEYEEKLKQSEERHQGQMHALEAQFQAKIMGEVERYHALQQEKELLNERWDEQNALLVESHERVILELTEEYEEKLQEEQVSLHTEQQEKGEAAREFEETKRQLEEDADREIDALKKQYEAKLTQEREVGLRLKGENGIMKKKFNALQKDIDDQKEEIKQLFEQKKELYQTIGSLEKDIAGLKKEISERDETIGDKEKRIYDLKKKNQELEKFKFVLDYKIKELKKQIEPRELEIADMKEQIKEMDHELERYHKNNASLDLTISDLKLKLDGIQKESLLQRKANQDLQSVIRQFHHNLHETAQHIQDPKALKESVKKLYQKHCAEDVKPTELEEDIQKEYNRQREYLEKSVESLKRKLHKDMESHRQDNMRIMQENVTLIKEINELRREVRQAKSSKSRGELDKKAPTKKRSASAGVHRPLPASVEEAGRELEMQKAEISKLQSRIFELERALSMHEKINPRPMSRERLPPMEGFGVDGGAGQGPP
eukprot:CAMPEP_0118921440 /NCGR_PEP_ID=MMETSP1169-20130426/720_1 /TAXON_ID=36882 /ORGANISM="Pyramimonas obovata, Strain CCMP722" /LENGTH=1196 /DNA_ID=CAMNT_0006862159 /DNA_START=210 /DNA_END=3800 /DNA_ORIENTATION=+